MDSTKCPPLGAGSVEFNAVHAAARQNHDLEKAIADAKTLNVPKDAETVPTKGETLTEAQPVDEPERAADTETAASSPARKADAKKSD